MAYDYITNFDTYESELEGVNSLRATANAQKQLMLTAIETQVLAHLTLEPEDYTISMEDHLLTIRHNDGEFDISQLTAFEAAFENAELTVSPGIVMLEFTEPP